MHVNYDLWVVPLVALCGWCRLRYVLTTKMEI